MLLAITLSLPSPRFCIHRLIINLYLGLPAIPDQDTTATRATDQGLVTARPIGIMIAPLNTVMEGRDGLPVKIVSTTQLFRQTAMGSVIPCLGTRLGDLALS